MAGTAPIQIGDLLTSSELAGYAKKATSSGMVIGRALEPLNASTGQVLAQVGTSFAQGLGSGKQVGFAQNTKLQVQQQFNVATTTPVEQRGVVLATTTLVDAYSGAAFEVRNGVGNAVLKVDTTAHRAGVNTDKPVASLDVEAYSDT